MSDLADRVKELEAKVETLEKQIAGLQNAVKEAFQRVVRETRDMQDDIARLKRNGRR